MQKIGFIYTNKSYSVYHSLSVAIELSANVDYDVYVLTTKSNQDLVVNTLQRFKCKAVKVKVLRPYWYITIPHYFEIKLQLRPSLFHKYAKYLNTFDAFVCTMYDDLYLKKVLSNPKIKYIFSNHGISNRAYSFDNRITNFDLFFLLDKNDQKIREDLGQLNEGKHVYTGFVKYDLIKDLRITNPFKNDKPIVIYNPHWENRFTSFHKFGKQILEAFSTSKKYNLIFAPHSLLLSRNWKYISLFKKFSSYENIYVDYKSEFCNNMNHTRLADIYIGDISSQVFEFLYEKPKPCLFLDAHNLTQSKENKPLSWDLGEVIDEVINVEEAIETAYKKHKEQYLKIQEQTLSDMFEDQNESATSIAVRAIKKFL